MNHDKWIEFADLYAVGALDGGDLAEFSRHFQNGCELCESRLLENSQALHALLKTLPSAPVPAQLKTQILEIIEKEEAASPVLQWELSPLAAAGIWAAISFLILAGWHFTGHRRRVMEMKQMEHAAESSAATRTVEMQAMEAAPKASAKIILNPKKGECLLMALGLPKIDKHKSYQVWGIKGRQRVSMGIFSVDEYGCAMMTLKNVGNEFEKLAVTLEPAGGRPSPTGPTVLFGTL